MRRASFFLRGRRRLRRAESRDTPSSPPGRAITGFRAIRIRGVSPSSRPSGDADDRPPPHEDMGGS